MVTDSIWSRAALAYASYTQDRILSASIRKYSYVFLEKKF